MLSAWTEKNLTFDPKYAKQVSLISGRLVAAAKAYEELLIAEKATMDDSTAGLFHQYMAGEITLEEAKAKLENDKSLPPASDCESQGVSDGDTDKQRDSEED